MAQNFDRGRYPLWAANNFAETFRDPQVIHRKMIVEVNHPRLGKIKQIGIPIKLSRTGGKIQNPPPEYGEHTIEILKGMGYTEEAIQDLRGKKIIE